MYTSCCTEKRFCWWSTHEPHSENPCLPCNLWESVTAGHVQRCPSFFISLVDICSILDQQLHTLQVARQDGLMNGCHTWGRRPKFAPKSPRWRFHSLMSSCQYTHLRCTWCPEWLSWPAWIVQSSPAHPVSRSPGRECHWGSGHCGWASTKRNSCSWVGLRICLRKSSFP